MNEKIKQLSQAMIPWLREQRRYLHMHPEASAMEYETSRYLRQVLEELGYEVEGGFYNTGLAVTIPGGKSGPVTGMRFDIDALAMEELCTHDYVSQNPGFMHACGHDAHAAIGLGVAKALRDLKADLAGTVKLIFQPAEEDSPNGGGAQYMIRDGVLENHHVDRIFGIHIYPAAEKGTVITRPGIMTAASDPFTLTITGKGAHASTPQMGLDPIMTGGYVLTALQSIVGRNIDPFDQAVVTVGVFNGGTRYNVIPESVTMEGTVRTFREEVRQKVAERVKQVVTATSEAMGCTASIDYRLSYPSLTNDGELVESSVVKIKDQLGEAAVQFLDKPLSGSEDFSYFAMERPAMFMFLGVRTEDNGHEALHNPYFDFDEACLAEGVEALLSLVIQP